MSIYSISYTDLSNSYIESENCLKVKPDTAISRNLKNCIQPSFLLIVYTKYPGSYKCMNFRHYILEVIKLFFFLQQSKETLSSMQTTGIAMLFSAGTFLYVATVHVLPEISVSQTQHKAADGTVTIRDQKGFKMTELAALIFGSLLPVVLAVGHKH